MLSRTVFSTRLTPSLRGAWRNALTRPGASRLPRIRTYYPPPQHAGFASRLLYRADGTPRSKWKGLALGAYFTIHIPSRESLQGLHLASSLSITLFLFYQTAIVVEELDSAVQYLTILVHAQRVDQTYHLTDLSNFDDTLSLFRAFRGSFGLPSEMVDQFFDDVRRMPDGEGHRMMRAACERVHNTLHDEQLWEEDPLELALRVVQALDEATVEILEALNELLEDGGVQIRNQKIKGQMLTDGTGSKSEGSDYEAVG
ncbi:hypothetical protein HGRIS_008709 [Hohenbuehelia grisea]|uniref:Uncharacterized protein n=1 Tax=Hohenbuehelia grisea TaxID=104357 RepID=A0ABR3J9D3_9AGAR